LQHNLSSAKRDHGGLSKKQLMSLLGILKSAEAKLLCRKFQKSIIPVLVVDPEGQGIHRIYSTGQNLEGKRISHLVVLFRVTGDYEWGIMMRRIKNGSF